MSLTSWTTRYSQIHHPTLRGRLRHAALSGLSLGSKVLGSVDAALRRPRVHFVYLHHVFEDEVEPFRDLVRTLTSIMRPIDYSEGVERVLTNRIDRPYITFSFDDGFKNCLTAARVLEEFGAHACFFVCPGVVGEGDDQRVEEFCRDQLHLPPVEFMNWNDLESLLKRGHEIGNHTLQHERLDRAIDAREQIDRARAELETRLGSIRHFAWPYGHFGAISRESKQDVFATGHRSCASGQRGAHVVGANSPETFCIRRDHVIAGWPEGHVLYLLAKSARGASAADNDWPEHLR